MRIASLPPPPPVAALDAVELEDALAVALLSLCITELLES
jgi:hypothetical protein